MNEERVVALAIRNATMQADQIFDLRPDGPVDQAPYTPWRLVREMAAERGLLLITADRVAELSLDPRKVTLIAYDMPPIAAQLSAAGARMGILTSLEPPIIAWELYLRLPRLSARFPHVFLFGGAANRVAAESVFHPLHFPQVRDAISFSWTDWPRRRFMVSINSNKAMVRSFTRWFDRPREVSIKRELASKLYPPIGRDLYIERLRAIDHFADRPDFDVRGQGWERRHPAISRRLHERVLRAYRGPVAEKLATLAEYRFSLCLENSRFAGYVSEKIFDCFFTGTIPIYLGAPDIERYVPREAFVDLRGFRNYGDLERFLNDLDDKRARNYVEAAADYIQSPAYKRFEQEHFARELVDSLSALPW